MKKFAAGLVKKRGSDDASAQTTSGSPEENVARGVRLFCKSGNPNAPNAQPSSETQEYLHLPVIVESAESSPSAAKAAAVQIRKTIKDNYQKAYVQYNAIMLIRILTDNPGPSFTKNMDEKFRSTIQTLLQQGRDPSVQQLLMETLYALETEKAYDENLIPLMAMWRKERSTLMQRQGRVPQQGQTDYRNPQWPPQHRQQHRQRTQKKLPSPTELAGRIEEARMSAQLLTQVTQSTPTAEIESSELGKEFAGRCQDAQRNLQGFMNCTDPAPDAQTFQTLIESCELLNVAMSKHQRALLAARRDTVSSPPAGGQGQNPVLGSPPTQSQSLPREGRTVSPPPAQSQPGSNNPYYNRNEALSPTLYSSTANATAARGPANPFLDDNQVTPEPRDLPYGLSTTSQRQLYSDAPGPNPGSVELPLASTPPPGATLPGPMSAVPRGRFNDEDEFLPPPGPPPKRQTTLPLREQTQDNDDLYSSNSPITKKFPSVSSTSDGNAAYAQQPQSPRNAQPPQPGSPSKNPFVASEPVYAPGTTSEYAAQKAPSSPPRGQSPRQTPVLPQLQSPSAGPFQMQSTPSYVRRQDAAVSELTMHGGGSSSPPSQTAEASSATNSSAGAPASSAVPPRIKDDDPMTPMSAGAWQYGRY